MCSQKITNQPYSIKEDILKFDESPFLFLCQTDVAQKQLQHFKGEILLPDEKIAKFHDNIQFNRDYASKTGTHYHHIVFPAKIPTFEKLFSQAGINVTPMFSEAHTGPNISYLDAFLIPEKHFLVQDTHNSDMGRIALSSNILQLLNLPKIDDEFLWESSQVLGDMGKRLNLEPFPEQKMVDIKNVKTAKKLFHTASALSGNSGMIMFFFNALPKFNKRLLVFGDSFVQSCLSILSFYFSEVIYLRSPFIIPDIADNLEPDFILTSNAERYLTSIQNAKAKKPYFLNYFSSRFNPDTFHPAHLEALTALFSGRDSHEYKKWKRDNVSKVKT